MIKKIKAFIKKLFGGDKPLVVVVSMEGVIGAKSTGRKNINLSNLQTQLENAFKIDKAKAIAILINSPGGSPVQSDLIATKMRQLSIEKRKPILCFCEDAAASGGYWLAAAGDEIYAAPASIIGSIGVIFSGFGFDELIKRYGIQRRVYTQGKRKLQLDPFSPENPDDIEHIKELQADIHTYFKDYVRNRRGDKLKDDEDNLFSGQFWTGNKALELGLIDGLGHYEQVCREKFGENVKFKIISGKSGLSLRSLLEGKLGIFHQEKIIDDAVDIIIEKSHWSRLGL